MQFHDAKYLLLFGLTTLVLMTGLASCRTLPDADSHFRLALTVARDEEEQPEMMEEDPTTFGSEPATRDGLVHFPIRSPVDNDRSVSTASDEDMTDHVDSYESSLRNFKPPGGNAEERGHEHDGRNNIVQLDSSRGVSQRHFRGDDGLIKIVGNSEVDFREFEKGDSIANSDAAVFLNGTFDGSTLVKPSGVHVPKYMLDLYNNNLIGDNEKDGGGNNSHWFRISDTVKGFINANGEVYRTYDDLDNNAEARRGTETRIHTLVFNVTEMASNERLDYAELRLYALITRDQRTFLGVDRLVTIILVTNDGSDHGFVVLDSRHVYERSNAWETFNVTAAVRHWLTAPHLTATEQRLEVRIDSIFSTAGGRQRGHMDITTRPYKATEPLLLVFSSDPRRQRKRMDGEREEVDAEGRSSGSGMPSVTTTGSAAARSRRSVAVELTEEEEEEETNVIAGDGGGGAGVAARRHKKRRQHRNPCRRKPLTVNFGDINYDTWILAPREYEAFECSGKCYFPLSDHLTPSQHAIIQTLLHTLAPKKAPRACCVPTKLGSISILYLDKDGVATYKYRHDDMVVTECGCR